MRGGSGGKGTSARRSLPSDGMGGMESAKGSADDDLLPLLTPLAFCVGFRTFPSECSEPMLIAKVARGPAVVVVLGLEAALALCAAASADFFGEGLTDMAVKEEQMAMNSSTL